MRRNGISEEFVTICEILEKSSSMPKFFLLSNQAVVRLIGRLRRKGHQSTSPCGPELPCESHGAK
jgi:hypothetical protein